MGAATRTSTADGIRALDAIEEPSADLGEQLLSAARALGTSSQLVSVLSDGGVPADQRAALVDRVFSGLGSQAKQVLGALVSGRWSVPRDLVAGVEETGYRALAVPASSDGLEGQLFRVVEAISSDGQLELAVGNGAAPVDARLALVDRLLEGALPATTAIVRHVVQSPRGRRPIEALDQAQQIVAAARDRLVAVVQSATPLNAEQQQELADRLASGYGRKISINLVVDPSLLGGVRITVGDDVIDGTVRARLDDLRQRLAG